MSKKGVASTLMCLWGWLLFVGVSQALATPQLRLIEPPFFVNAVKAGLPPVQQRVPTPHHVTDMQAINRQEGEYGGTLKTLVTREKDSRLMNAWGYARLLGYTPELHLKPDILRSYSVEEGRIFTFELRSNHRWSDGAPFTSQDFRFWYEDIANNDRLRPGGLPSFLLVEGKPPRFKVLSKTKFVYAWHKPNPQFLPELAKARPPFIYRPYHYLKQFHAKYADIKQLSIWAEQRRLRGWAPLFNRLDDMYGARNADLPTLQPWHRLFGESARRIVFARNPFFHRVDSKGKQLPYIDRVIMTVVDNKIVATKTQAGETHLQARGLKFADISLLKQAQRRGVLSLKLWRISKGSQISILPNLNVADKRLRKLFQNKHFRHALSLAINRKLINKVLYFGLAVPANDTVLPKSPLFMPHYQTAWTNHAPEVANKLLDEIGLKRQGINAMRHLPDGTPLRIIVELSGERQEQIDAMELVAADWRDIGIEVFVKPSQRDVIRARALSGELMMSVWTGFENGIPTAHMLPDDYAPTRSDFLSWPQWGLYYESSGNAGQLPQWLPAKRLIDLYKDFLRTQGNGQRESIWRDILEIHANNTIHIGLISQVRQPVAVKDLQNVPGDAFYGWDPGAHFGIHRMDAFFFPKQ
ncbi:ABC transporter substrate-binding protein [Polycladidibacter stylochi]|uniref:ABC transporter substrate-binding protein n=1 Tax=Polycladidibacter stylochi TaxID=1807766 RepID=UPI000AC0DFAC|nr:ABC transporter substrate-binding protein [Pseudovibrio stylochi]